MNETYTPSSDLIVDQERSTLLKDLSLKLPEIILNKRQLCDFELLANGAFSPLQGFMVQADYESVLDRMRLQDGTLWPIPICLDISKTLAETLEVGQSVVIRDPEAFQLGMMHVEDIWPVNHEDEAIKVYGTKDPAHPGVNYFFNNTGDYYIGGKLEVINLPIHSDFKQIRLTPQEVRNTYQKLGWKRIVGFHTRNPIHRPQYEMTIEAMKQSKANLLLLPNTGISGPNDFDYYTRVRCYNAVNKQYPPDTSLLSLLPYAMRFSGAREAILHAIISKNYGCTHFIVGHNHAMPGNGSCGNPFYESQEIIAQTKAVENEIGISIVPFEKMVYLPFEDEYRFVNQIEDKVQTLHLSSGEIRKRIQFGKKIPDWAIFPDVEAELKKSYPPPQQQGLTIFVTGLSGAGKSTIARVLYAKFLELGNRPVTLLDGDIVRRNLSSELNFSKEHRDINVRRIGFVASEITKNRGVALCAPIAPYSKTRAEIRKNIERYGGFVEVYVSTPIAECEKRDRKGMYAKARAGLIKGFTGVDDPYEEPKSAEINIDTSKITPDEAVQEILLFLGQKGYI
jgi:sulfate adenylyltransferase